MIGAIIGDIAGSRFEWHNNKSKDFELFHKSCRFTDDSVMSLAICDALLNANDNNSDLSDETVRSMQKLGNSYPRAGYGGAFRKWLNLDNPQPYNSWGNGAGMRVSGCGYAGNTLDEVRALSKAVTEVTHNHPEGLKGAEAVAVAVFLARTGKSITEIKNYITENYYPLDFTLDEIRDDYTFDVSCQGSVPQALEAFFESTGFEDAIRNAVSIGGDTDTIAAMAGSIAGAYYGVPDEVREGALNYLTDDLKDILLRFENMYVKTK